MRVAPIFGFAFALLIGACSGVKPVPPGAPGAVAPASPPLEPTPPTIAKPSEVAAPGPVNAHVAPPETAGPSAVKPASPAPKGLAAVPKTPVAQPPKKESPAPEAAKQPSPTLDLRSLEQRLKDTKAIGVLTKIALKNQVDDLLDQFRAYYQGKLKITLAELRRPYDLLIMKVLSLLQDSDPSLASALVASREAIWGILSDPAKFATVS